MKTELSLKLIDTQEFCFAGKKGKIQGTFQVKTYKIDGWKGSDVEILSYINSKGVILKKSMILSKNHPTFVEKVDLEQAGNLFKIKRGQYCIDIRYKNN